MLLQPRTFKLLQLPDKHTQGQTCADFHFYEQTQRARLKRQEELRAKTMLLVHQSGSVKVGEVVRYTVTYTPSQDRVLPTPSSLHVKVRNSSAIPLRAAWVHGPYTLHVGVYPSTFNPHHKVEHPERDGVPQYEPMLKAGGSWTASLLIPEDIRENLGTLGNADVAGNKDKPKSVTWIVEIASQILFSTSASVGFEVLIGRDERSVEFGFAAAASVGHGGPGVVKENPTEEERRAARRRGNVQMAGVYSKAVKLVVEDTQTLWDKPPLPSWDEDGQRAQSSSMAAEQVENNDHQKPRKRKNVHLVIITHGLQSNIGADMLFLKESIDATVKEARMEARKRKAAYRSSTKSENGAKSSTDEEQNNGESSTAPLSGGQEDINETLPEDSDDDEEETIVRGFNGNAVRTGNGIQYLGKRLAKYILRFTYPDQPFMPIKRKFSRTITDSFKREDQKVRRDGAAAHHHSTIHHPEPEIKAEDLPYKFTSISFVGHSLGGLIQTYAIAYISKHSPEFFTQIKPVNFICMASPMLGLSNENPLYVKFALDFGLVGRTGRDLGLSWNPTHAKSGWNTMISGLGVTTKDADTKKAEDPSAKPLLRILPTGPAHRVLHMFCNRTVYSNVVNDGIVPLRTSCLLFLDWQGLGKVEKARRENGFVGTLAEWGWAELTGANASTITPNVLAERYDNDDDDDDDDGDPPDHPGEGSKVPLPAEDETAQDNKQTSSRLSYDGRPPSRRETVSGSPNTQDHSQDKGVFDTFIDFFRPAAPLREKTPPIRERKTSKALRRAQTIQPSVDGGAEDEDNEEEQSTTQNPTMRPHMPHLPTGQVRHRGSPKERATGMADNGGQELHAPPKTSIFESAGDILHPPLPSRQWITDPSSRSRTIFHDRVYHPEDIPPPPVKPRHSGPLSRAGTSIIDKSNEGQGQDGRPHEYGSMKVEEKIARAYHRDLSWRKVLVRLEPDAHNNMVVRRMFANAYGWPVVKHLCDTHFANTYTAQTRDEDEPTGERAKPADAPINAHGGEQVKGQTSKSVPPISDSQGDYREDRDELVDLQVAKQGLAESYSSIRSNKSADSSRQSSTVWDDVYLEGSDGDDSDAVDDRNFVQRLINPLPRRSPTSPRFPDAHNAASTASPPVITIPPTAGAASGHLGLAPASPLSPRATLTTGVAASPGSAASRQRALDTSQSIAKSTFDSGDVDSPILHGRLVDEPHSIDSPIADLLPAALPSPSLSKDPAPSAAQDEGKH